jgi:N-acetylglucosamine kinase
MSVFWGIDLGGTKIEGVVLDEALQPVIRQRIDTGRENGYEHILERIGQLVHGMEGRTSLQFPDRIGIGAPGRADGPDGIVKNSNTGCLNGKPLLRDLERVLGTRVILENDANCFALAEAMLGAGRDIMTNPGKTAFGIILGTGVGGGIVIGGRVMRGAHGIAGEWGHTILAEHGDPCYCGRRGCVETVISGPALERYYCVRSGKTVPLQEIAVSSHDAIAKETIGRLVNGFGKALGAVINILDPDVVIIGGGVGNIGQLYGEEARAAVSRHVFNRTFDIPLLRPLLGDSAGVFGSALLTRG